MHMDERIEMVAYLLYDYYNDDKIVPIVGDELFSVNNETIRKFVLEKILSDKEKAEYYCSSSYYGMEELFQIPKENPSDLSYKDRYITLMSRLQPEMDSTVKQFLTTFQFKKIITTSPFPFLENVLGNEYKSVWNTQDGTIQDKNMKNMDVDDDKKQIIHVFGKKGDGVFTEMDLLNYLHGMNAASLSQGSLPWMLNQFLANKKLMVIGCDLPNWIFRFLWCSVKNSSNSDGYWMNNNGQNFDEKGFDHFLAQVNFTKYGINDKTGKDYAREIMKKACEIKVGNATVRERRQFKYDIFISHAGDEHGTKVAREISDILSEMDLRNGRKIRVWIDRTERQNNVDGQYQRRWEYAIDNSRFFMPVVSGKYLERMFDSVNNLNVSLKQETDYAIKQYQDREYDENITYFLPVIETGQEFAMVKSYNVDEGFLEFFSSPSNPFRFLPSEVFFGMDMRNFDRNPKDSIDKDVRNKDQWQNLFEKYGLL